MSIYIIIKAYKTVKKLIVNNSHDRSLQESMRVSPLCLNNLPDFHIKK